MDIEVFLKSKDPIKNFAHWYIKKIVKDSCLPLNTIYNNVSIVSDCFGVVLFRQYPFQVQLWLCKSNQKSPEHTHPDIDTYEVYFGGDMTFTKNGKKVQRKPKELEDLKSSAWGWFMRINSDDKHEAVSGDTNVSFLSIQYWKNNIPASSVEKNWKGEKFGENHIILN
jgi:hypothetical protein